MAAWSSFTSFLEHTVPVDIIYLDFEKAFDRVPHRRLLHKLEHFGIKGLLLQWIAAFLRNRSFTVKVGSSVSSNRQVLSGVPQGSVLGPILFLIYVSDLLRILNSSHAFYADDGKLYENPLTSHQTIQDDLTAVHNWTCSWLMPLNVQKCFILRLGKNNLHMPYRWSSWDTISRWRMQV